jgi:hypothetical protein
MYLGYYFLVEVDSELVSVRFSSPERDEKKK